MDLDYSSLCSATRETPQRGSLVHTQVFSFLVQLGLLGSSQNLVAKSVVPKGLLKIARRVHAHALPLEKPCIGRRPKDSGAIKHIFVL